MGCVATASTANLYMADLERTQICNAHMNLFWGDIIAYWRYIDDLCIIYRNPESIKDFCLWMNNVDPSTQFL